MGNLAAFIIHLERATDRAENVGRLLAQLPVVTEVLPAVDSQTVTAEEAARYTPGRWTPRYPFPLSVTEVAVFLSHRKAWAEIVERGLDGALIVEDDVALAEAQFSAAFGLARSELLPEHYIRLPQKDRERPGDVLSQRDGTRLIRPEIAGVGMQAQLVGRTAAERLLEVTETFDRPVDTTLVMTWETGVDVLAIWPTGVRDISTSLGGSTLKKRRGTAAKIAAEFKRARYRAAIARAASRAK